jgi:hypothetical protein
MILVEIETRTREMSLRIAEAKLFLAAHKQRSGTQKYQVEAARTRQWVSSLSTPTRRRFEDLFDELSDTVFLLRVRDADRGSTLSRTWQTQKQGHRRSGLKRFEIFLIEIFLWRTCGGVALARAGMWDGTETVDLGPCLVGFRLACPLRARRHTHQLKFG